MDLLPASILFISLLALNACTKNISSEQTSQYDGSGRLTRGLAQTKIDNLFEQGKRKSGVGEIPDVNSKIWTVPAITRFLDESTPTASDLHNNNTFAHEYATAEEALGSLSL